MLKLNFVILAAAYAIFPTGAYAAPLKPDHHPPEITPAITLRRSLRIEPELAHHNPRPRPRRHKRRDKPHASITINI